MDHSRVNPDTTVLYRLRDWTRIRVHRARTQIVVICTQLISVTSVMLVITVSVGANLNLQLGILTTFPQCNLSLEFQETLTQNHIWYH